MPKIVVHADVGSELARTEWESDTTHSLFSGTSFPGTPSEMDLFYRTDEHIWYIYNGSEWKDLTGAGVSTFVGLSDTPSVYTGVGGYFVRVNSTPDGLEFVQYVDHDSDLSNVSADDHHSEAHVLAISGPHTGTLPLTDLAVGTQGGIIRRGGADWEEYALGTEDYVLKVGATDVVWGQVDWSELANKPSSFTPSVHEMVDSIHTDTGLTIGYVIRASGASAFAWAELQHGDLGGVTSDLHHNEAHVLAVTGPHTGTLPLADLAVGTQGGIVRRGAVDWEEYAIGTENYVLKAGATDVVWGQVAWGEITDKPINPIVRDSQKNQQLTGTGETEICAYTIDATDRIMRVAVFFRVVTATTTVTVKIYYTNAVSQAVTCTLVDAKSLAVSDYTYAPLIFEIDASTEISLRVTAGTANQVYVTGTIEEMV